MRKILVLLWALSPISLFAKIWIVDSNVGSTIKDFVTLNDAYTGAAAGDTLYLIGSPNNYITSTVTLTKRLVIIGPGYFLSQNPDTQASLLTAFLDTPDGFVCENLVFSPGSEGSVVMGVTSYGNFLVNTSNILIKRNQFQQSGGACGVASISVSASNVLIVQNFIDSFSYGTGEPLIRVNIGFTGILIANNYIRHNCSGCGGSVAAIRSNGSSLEVSNNVLIGGIEANNALVQNNIFTTNNSFTVSSSIVRNNLHAANNLPGADGNQNGVLMSTVFVGTGSPDGQYALKAGSPAIGAGFGGVDAGIFSGTEPYVLSGLPPIPSIYSLVAPAVGEKNTGLPVQIKVKSNN